MYAFGGAAVYLWGVILSVPNLPEREAKPLTKARAVPTL